MEKDSKLTTVFEGSPMEAAMLCEVLIDQGIEATQSNALMGSIAPHIVPDVKVMVLEKDKEKALLWVEEFKKSK
ncbi:MULTISPECIES: putative signal transducing protein [unclassified Carboxylicivirga]|uniref:putative signal transducing protein n=1 Tax=Carboxylicivirga TaxID=1628153 RepID=UPI003D33DD9C